VNGPADKDTLRVGIIGCGLIARSHALSYQNNARVELVGVVDLDPARGGEFAARYGTNAYRSSRELLDQQPDLVSVATPPGTHTEVAVELLEAGCSVLLEKPPTTTLADMDVLAAAEELSSGSVYVVFQHRHGSGARRAHDLLHSGALGTPLVAVCETLWYRPDSYFLPEWRGNWVGEGGGPTLGHGIHQIDLLLHLLGTWETVDGRAARIARPVEFEDVSLAIVTFGSGAVGTVVTSLLSPRELSRIRVDTSGGTLEVNHLYGYSDADWSWTPVPDATTAASLGRDPGLPRADDAGHAGLAHSQNIWAASAELDLPSNHAAQIDHLVDDMLAGRRHDTTLASARPTMEFITALYESSIEHETVYRRNLTPADRFYHTLNGGLSADTITARLGAGRS
jgi:predicted dehydrogenase